MADAFAIETTSNETTSSPPSNGAFGGGGSPDDLGGSTSPGEFGKTITITSVSVNNVIYKTGDIPIEVEFSSPIVNWAYSTINQSIRQVWYETRVGCHRVNWGNSNYMPDVYRQPYTRNPASFWRFKEKFINRGTVYYGQIRLKDNLGGQSDWATFSFKINRQPRVTSARITPSEPTISSDLILNYNLTETDADVFIKWYRNGVHQEQFDNYESVSKDYMRYLDVWSVDITPHDNLENGPTYTLDSVTVAKIPPIASNLEVLPKYATDQDILQASYTVIDPNIDNLLLDDRSEIRWYVNGFEIENARDAHCVRLALKPDDQVFFTVTPSDGMFAGETVSSDVRTIIDAGFRITNLRVDGQSDNINVSTVNPTVEWNIIEPFRRFAVYALIEIGTAPGSNNIFRSVVKTFEEKFTIPDNVIERGVDYYVTVSSSDTPDNFTNKQISHFRVAGVRWEENADNARGWTIEVSLRVQGVGYQYLSIADGSRFAQIRFYENLIEVMLGGGSVKRYETDLTDFKNIIVCGKANTIKVFEENTLVIDGSEDFLTQSASRFIEVGSSGDSESIGHYKRLNYTTFSSYLPDESNEYSRIQFCPFIDFVGKSVSSITEHNGDILVATNPRNSDQSGEIYKIVETQQPVLTSAENLDDFSVELYSVSASPDEKFVYYGHTKGASFFENYHIAKYDINSDFTGGKKPDIDKWELVQTTPFLAANYSSDGLIIDTTFGNTGRIDDRTQLEFQPDVAALIIRHYYESEFLFSFWIEVTNTNFIVLAASAGSSVGSAEVVFDVSLDGKTIQDICDLINNEDDFFTKNLLKAEPLNGLENQSASRLYDIQISETFPSLTLTGRFKLIDSDNPNPYSYTSGGKWFYSHRKYGTPWFEKVSNTRGWTVDFDIIVDSVEDSDRPSSVDGPEGLGLYVNDGTYYENIHFLTQEVILGQTRESVLYDTTTFTKFRVTGKGDQLKIFAKKDTDLYYNLLVESRMIANGTNQANAGRPAVVQASNGFMHAIWHDDGNNGKRQLYYSYFDPNLSLWSEPDLIVKDDFGALNPDIAIDGFGNIYVVFETLQTDYSDIAVIIKNEHGWSEPYLITTSIGSSLYPKIAIDETNNIHVVWQDYRLTESEIYYCRRNAADGQWISSAFGQNDIRISDAANGASRPSISTFGLNVYIAWTMGRFNGTTAVNVSYYNAGSKTWFSSGQGKFDFPASSTSSLRADYADVIIDKKGRPFVVYHDLVDKNYQVFARRMNTFLTVSTDAVQITTGDYDSRYAKIGMNESTGDLYVVFEKEQDKFTDPYVPYVEEQDFNRRIAGVYIARFNAAQQIWESGNQTTRRAGIDYGGFDVHIDPVDNRTSRKPVIARKYSGDMHILYEAELVVEDGSVLPNKDLFKIIRDAVFDHTFEAKYSLADDAMGEYGALDPYLERDQDLSGKRLRKEIRFGDFSNTVGAKFSIARVRYYLNDAVEPFNIRLLSSATLNMPSANIYAVKANNRGDAYLATDDGLLFFDKSKNDVFSYSDESTGIAGLVIKDIATDSRGNLYLATDSGIFVSHDHVYFWKLTGSNIPDSATNIEIDLKNRLYIGSSQGLTIVVTETLVDILKTTDANYQEERSVEVTESVKIDDTNGLPSNTVNVVRVDANGVAWIGTNKGLVRYRDGKSYVFTQRHGLAANKILDITIRNTAIRYIASASGVDKMTGVNIERLDFDNINAPVASLIERSTTEVEVPNFNNTTAILWKEPNLLFICSLNDIYQVTFLDEQFYTEQTQISKFPPSMYALIEVETVRNDDLYTFRLVGVEDLDIPETALFEVYLNGKAINAGFAFSAKHQLLRFGYPLNKHDVIKVNVRLDVEKIANFGQNKAQQIALGNKIARIDKLISANGNIYAKTSGDVNTIQVNDLENDLPFDRIILDTIPPVGKIRIGDQIDQTTVRVHIDQIDPYTPFDNASGINTCVVSNFTNFTSDGETSQTPVPFVTSINHDLGIIFEDATKQFSFSNATGSCIGRWDRSGNSPVMFAGAGYPARIYGFSPTEELWTLRATLDIENEASIVNFIASFNNILIVGTGSDVGIGKVYKSLDGQNFDLIASLPSSHARCAEVHNGILYIGTSGDEGRLLSFDGSSLSTVFVKISSGIFDLVSADNVLYAATGEGGRIYRLDPQNSTQQIVHVDSDSRMLSISSGSINGVDFVFAGTSTSAKIIRQRLPDSAFTHSFRTVANPVYAMENIGSQIHAAIGKTLFVLDGVWQAKYTHSEAIIDLDTGPDGKVWFCSANHVYKIDEIGITRNVYLKMIDKAGNETSLFLDDEKTELDPNLHDSVTISDLVNFVNKNRIIEVNEVGDTVLTYNGDDRFYSADKVDQEMGIYFSEIFNGTNSIVRWDTISWDSIVPGDTDLTVYIRTGSSRDLVLDAEFKTVLSNDDTPSDISYLSGQYLQFKVVMTSKIRNLSPSLKRVVVKSIASESTHFFTTNFMLPSRVKSGIFTSQKMIPVAADIIVGVNTSDSVDFGDYQVIDENRIFTTDETQVGKNLRVGIRLITPSRGETISEDFGEYGPYNTLLAFNSIEWAMVNLASETQTYNFRVSFYEDAAHNVLTYQVSTQNSTSGFSGNGELFETSGFTLERGERGQFSFTPVGDSSIVCNTYYFVKIESNDGTGWRVVSDSESFIEACGTTFVDSIDFDFQNDNQDSEFHFRIRFYDDAERTNLVLTTYSGNNQDGWESGGEALNAEGVSISAGRSSTITYSPSLTSFERGVTYYLSIDAFDGSRFTTHSNSFTFRIQDVESDIYCGPYRDVPVIKNLAIMFELEGGQFVTLRLED